MNFIFSHIGASVVLGAALELAGYTVFSDSISDSPLVNTKDHKTPLYSYIALLDVCSKALVDKAVKDQSYTSIFEQLKSFVSNQKGSKVEVSEDWVDLGEVNVNINGMG